MKKLKTKVINIACRAEDEPFVDEYIEFCEKHCLNRSLFGMKALKKAMEEYKPQE